MRMFKFWDKKKNGNKLIKNFNDFLMFAERIDYQPNLENFLMTAYKNPFVAGALDRLEKGMQNIDWNTYKKGNKDNLNLVNKSLIVNTIARPSLLTNQDDFISYLMFYYLLDGECLVRKIRTASKYDLMIYKKNMYSYKFLDIAGTVELKVNGESILDVDNYYIFRNTNIYSHIAGAGNGRSTIESLLLLHDYYCLIMNWNNEVMRNDGVQPYAITSDTFMQTDAKKEILNKIKQAEKGEPLFLDGTNLKIQSLGAQSLKDFDYLQALDEIRNITANVLGVPSILIGDRTNQKFSNYKEAKEALYTETLLPIADKIKSMLNEFLSQDFELNEFVDYDTERIEVLQENRTEKMNSLNNISFLSINEKRAELGYSEVDGGDEILMNGIQTPLSEMTTPVTPVAEDVTSVEDV